MNNQKQEVFLLDWNLAIKLNNKYREAVGMFVHSEMK